MGAVTLGGIDVPEFTPMDATWALYSIGSARITNAEHVKHGTTSISADVDSNGSLSYATEISAYRIMMPLHDVQWLCPPSTLHIEGTPN